MHFFSILNKKYNFFPKFLFFPENIATLFSKVYINFWEFFLQKHHNFVPKTFRLIYKKINSFLKMYNFFPEIAPFLSKTYSVLIKTVFVWRNRTTFSHKMLWLYCRNHMTFFYRLFGFFFLTLWLPLNTLKLFSEKLFYQKPFFFLQLPNQLSPLTYIRCPQSAGWKSKICQMYRQLVYFIRC